MVELRRKYGLLVATFLRCVSKENGEYLHLPYAGGAMDQPYKTMEAFDLLQNVYVEKIQKDNKDHVAKIQARARPTPNLRR
jgi:hypothetical protein